MPSWFRPSPCAVVFLAITSIAACQTQAPDEGGAGGTPAPGGSGGRSGGGGTPAATGGTPAATGGTPAATGGTPAATGGTPAATGGATGTGGAAATGGAPGSGGAGGSDATSTTPEGGSPAEAGPAAGKASPGCGKLNPPVGPRTLTTGGRTGNFIVKLPAGYDPSTPQPLGFAFHGYGRTFLQCSGSDCPGFNALAAITVFPASFGPGWEDKPSPLAPNLKMFEDLLVLMKNEYCVDEGRIFVAGVSSGGQFVEHLACKYGDQLLAVSPIAAYLDQGADTACKGTPAQIVIHGVTDLLTTHAHPVRNLYAKRNGCTAPTAALAKAEADMKAAFDAKKAEVACVDYEGCKSPLRYCVFSQVTYDGLTHGWPKMGGTLIQTFLNTLK